MGRLSRALPKTFSLPVGRKEVWLPSFTITLLRTTYLPATMACFQVPLKMNKLDMKDYLWHAYQVPVISVRSYVKHQRVRQGKADDILLRRGYWTRPKSTKRMIVELGDGEHGGPFAWPEPYTDLKDFDKDSWQELRKFQDEQQTRTAKRYLRKEPKSESTLAEQAKQLLSGSQTWKPLQAIYNKDNKTF